MRSVLLTMVIFVCAISVYASHPRPTIVLNYSFEPVANDGKLVMRILLEFQSGPIETADLVVPTTWGDAKDLDKGITWELQEQRCQPAQYWGPKATQKPPEALASLPRVTQLLYGSQRRWNSLKPIYGSNTTN